MNKKGFLADIFVWIIVVFITLLFLGAWIYFHQIFTDTIVNVPTSNSVNVSRAAEIAVVPVNAAMAGLRWFVVGMFFAMIMAIFITNFLIKAHPLFLVPYILIVIIAVIFGVSISNAYEIIRTDSVLGATYQSFTAMDYIILNLPMSIAIVGLLGAIFLFVGASRDREAGGII